MADSTHFKRCEPLTVIPPAVAFGGFVTGPGFAGS
jgi:hypothetical protein